MKRKLVKQGHNALTVTLPASWVKKFNLRGGNEIDLNEDGKRINISVDELSERKVSFDMMGDIKYLYRFLVVLYRLGYDEVRINFKNPAIINDLQIGIENMLGYEILDQGENYCIVKSVAGTLEKEFDSTLKKIFSILVSGGEVSLEIIEKGETGRLESIKNIAKINNRLTNFCERLLNKFGYKDANKTTLVYCMVWDLEQIADEYKNIWERLTSRNDKQKKKKAKISEKEIDFYRDINKLVKDYYHLFYNFDANGVCLLKEKCLNFMNKSREMIDRESSIDKVVLLSLHLIAEKIYHMTESLIEIPQ